MATLKGVVRSYGAAVRRAERDQQRRSREAAKRFKEQQKQLEFENAAQAVKDWNNYVDILKSFHKEASVKVNWQAIRNEAKPVAPHYSNLNETIAQHKLNNFKPSILDKVFGSTSRKIKNLENQVQSAKNKDQLSYQAALNEYHETLNDWTELQNIAEGVTERDTEAYLAAVRYFDPFSEISELGSQIRFRFLENHIEVDMDINSIDVIPDYELKLTSTGKLSRKNMAKGNFYELYQDHVCSVVLRISREVFAYLPVDFAIINAKAEMVDPQSGHLEKKIILSIKIMPETIQKLNLDMIDPSDSMRNFVHNMNFKKTSGFSEVDKVS